MTNSETERLARGIGKALMTPDHHAADEGAGALRAIHDAGYRVVPVEPTEAIRQAYYRADVGPASHWRAMLAASPIQPEEGE